MLNEFRKKIEYSVSNNGVVQFKLSLNFDKTYYMQFITKNKFLNKINTDHDNKMTLQTNFVKFLGITIDNTLSWKQHIETITPKLNKACYINKLRGLSPRANYTDRAAAAGQ